MKTKVLSTEDEIRAFSDPYRFKILTNLWKFQKPATVKQIADAMGEVPAKVHYHVKKLEKVGILELSHTKEINGIIAKYYKTTAGSFRIKGSEFNPSVARGMLNKTQTIIAMLYDESKEVFLNYLDKKSKSISDEKNKMQIEMGLISKSELYLTDNEVEEFEKLLEKVKTFVNNHDEDNRENAKAYHFFKAMFPIEENGED